MEITIRPLVNRDLFTVIGMLSKIAGTAGKELQGLISSRKTVTAVKTLGDAKNRTEDEEAEKRGLQIVMIIFNVCYEHVQQDLINWFASLCGKTTEEYLDQMPPDTTVQIMEQLIKVQEATSFFTHVWQLFKKIKSSENPSSENSR